MANYTSTHTGAQIDSAITEVRVATGDETGTAKLASKTYVDDQIDRALGEIETALSNI